ncbi:trichohyalin-like [Portunus trituberculatus]|uniref:trichohyalin-like n=1 Tax=Portunus trituberculatus TaxID=210409 RepID=UPI001E1CF433|nr:trichohyalin-like [Portunus trituberculatus]
MKEEEERKRKEEERKIKEERERKIEEEEERKIKEEEERKMKEEERKIKEEERKVKEERERKMKEEEERKMKEKKERRMREIEKRMVKGKGERKIMNLEEMNRKSQKDKGKMYEQKREGQEQNKSCNNTEEKQCESKSEEGKRKNRETEIKQQEKQKRVSGVSLSDIKNSTSERESDIGASHSKNQEKIVFSWGPKRRQWRKYIKFHRMSRLTKVVPDPLGSLHHSVFAIECRVNQGSAQEQTNRSTTNGWLVRDPPRETSQVQNNGARDSITEEVSTRTRKTLPREQNIKEKIRRQLWDEQTCRGRKTVARRNKRISKIRDGSSSSSSRNRDKSSSRNSSRNRDKSSSKNRDNSSSRNSSRNRDKSSSRNRDKSSRRSRDKSSSNSSRSRSRSNIRNRDKRYGSSSSRTSIRNRHRIYESSSSSSSRSRSRSNIRNRDKRYGSSSSRTSIRNRHRRYESSSSRSRSRSSIRSRDRSYGSSCIDSRSCSRNRSRSSSRIRDRSNSSSSSRNRKRNNNSSNKNRDSSSSSKNKDRSKTSDNSSSRSSIRNKSRSNSRNSNRSRDRSSSISSSSSNCARETVCTFPREVKSGDRAPQQTCGSTKSAKTGNLSTLAKSRISKADLFGTDSDSSGSSEEKRKEQVKKSRKGKEDKQQQQPPMSLCNKGKNFRSASLIVRKAGGKWKSVKQPQFRRSRRLSSSYSSLPACLEEKLTNRRRDHSSDPETDLTTSDSSVTHRRVSSKCQRMVIGSEDEDSQDDRIPGVHLRRQRKTRMDGQISDSNNDNHNSPAKQKRTSHLTPNPHNACRVTQNKKQIPVDEELPEPHSKSTPSISSLTLKGKASKTLIAQQRKYTPAAKEREHQGISSDCRKLSSFSSKQQQKIKPSILKIHQTSASIPEVSTSLQSTRKREKSLDCIKQDQSRNSIKSEEDPMREKSMITSSLSKESKHTILLENPSHPFRKWKRNSLSWDPSSRQQKYHKLSDSCDMSDNLDETDRVDDNKDSLVLSQINSDTSMQSHDGDALMMSGDESETQVMSESHDPDIYNGLILSRSDSDSEDGMVIEENTSNSIGSSKDSVPQFSESIPETQVAATNRSQEGQVMRSSHLGPVALIDQPKFRKKPAPSPMPTTMRTSIPAGPEYIEKLFSSLNQKVERSLAGLTQNNHSTYPHGTNTSEAAGTASLNQPVRGIDYQGQFPVFLPNIYGTLQSAPAIEKPKPMSGTNPSHCTPHHSREAPHSALPISSHAFSSTEQIQPNSTSNKSHPVGYKHTTDGTSQVAPLQPLPSHSQNLQCSDASPVLKCNLQQMPWLPEIRLEEVTSGQQQKTLAIEELEEALEEILATRLGSKWWVAGLQQLCASINTKILPYFLRLVLKCIMCADPRDPHTKPKSLPPKLYQLFQVVFVIEQRLTPHYPRSLHNALLRAIQAIVSKPDFKITPQTLASLTTWYIASTSIDGQAKKGQKWRRARTFLMDLLFHHPNTVHLALLTGATASRGVFCKNIKNRVTSGLELVIVWLAHYGAWVGEPGVRSDLTKWLEQHCNMKKPPRNPAPLIKNLVTLLDPVKKRDLRWGAATSLVVLARWHSRAWARKHLLPPLLTAAGEISMAVSHQEKSCDADSKLIEDFSIKISHLFSNLSQALPRGPQEKDNDDVVEKLKDAVTLIFCSSHHTNDLQT